MRRRHQSFVAATAPAMDPLRLTAERRRFGLTEAHRYLSSSLAEHWCPSRAAAALSELAGKIESERPLDPASAQEGYEMCDPDREIWRELRRRCLVDPTVAKAFRKVSCLLPNEPMNELPHRSDEEPEMVQRNQLKSDRELYWAYVHSDEFSFPRNEISRKYRVPTRLARGVETKVSKTTQLLKGTNYHAGMVVAYLVSSLFGAAFAGMQAYQRGFARQFVSADCPPEVRARVSGTRKGPEPATSVKYPATGATGPPDSRATEERLAAIASFQQSDSEALARLTSRFAESDPEGPLASWLATSVSELLGRRVSVHYAHLLLANWAARRSSKKELWSRFASVFGVKCVSGLVVPVAGFGSGMTRKGLAVYTARLLLHLGALVEEGRRSPGVDPDRAGGDDGGDDERLEEIADGFFKEIGVYHCQGRRSVVDEEGGSGDCLSGLAGTEFVPCPARRRLKEEVYARALRAEPVLSFGFGKCGYLHPLSTNGDVKTQALKERLLFEQWNVAIAINHLNLVQFLLGPAEGRTAVTVKKAMLSMTRASIVRLSGWLLSSEATADVAKNMCMKFDSRLFFQGNPDVFLRARVGVLIERHAREFWGTPLPEAWMLEEARARLCGNAGADEPAVERALRRGWQSPFEGFGAEPIYPRKNEFADETATVCGQPTSLFWLEKTPEVTWSALDGCASLSETDSGPSRARRNERTIKDFSPKNTGQTGRKTTEFNTNSLASVSNSDLSICLLFCEAQKSCLKTPLEAVRGGRPFVAAPDISPVLSSVKKNNLILKRAPRL